MEPTRRPDEPGGTLRRRSHETTDHKPNRRTTTMRTRIESGTIGRILMTATLVTIGFALIPLSAEAQGTTYHACYVPNSGTVYRIGEPETPATCKSDQHVEFQWTAFTFAPDPVSQFTLVSVDAGATVAGSAVCPVNTIMYTGGFALHTDQLRVMASVPEVTPSALALRTWTVQVRNEGATPSSFGVYARCVAT
jgi:hypothetical protein